jgi:ELWxxDGT repeat protein
MDFGGYTYFFTGDGAGAGNAIYRTDGTPAGTTLVTTAVEARGALIPYGGALYYADYGTAAGFPRYFDVHRLDVSTLSSTLVAPGIGTPDGAQNPSWVVFGGYIYVGCTTPEVGAELCRSDGNTVDVFDDIAPGTASSSARSMTVVGNRLYFVANDGTHGDELWVTDGTLASTHLVKDAVPGAISSGPSWLFEHRGLLYFTAYDPTHGGELWRSDGTAAGTFLVRDIGPGSASSDVSLIVATDDAVYLRANDSVHGYEPWVMR